MFLLKCDRSFLRCGGRRSHFFVAWNFVFFRSSVGLEILFNECDRSFLRYGGRRSLLDSFFGVVRSLLNNY
ncbi:hypothetical protein IQ264_17035 [Phormidium sp. LEGE 05292]|uniref:hypothetical protein n=1 Tax=[Phormidium] sp. LEGE 05292 TaxID=767427 RepID=UPI0018817350|nr:hypothetical protein [Phormidium sp. LEGE 05292]MBE9227135.1 hypothetical protein [Phormidium sp. LEGE 05292]